MNSESFDIAYIAQQDISADHIKFIHDLSIQLHQTSNPLSLAYHFLFDIPEDNIPKSIVSRLVPRDYFLKHSHLCRYMELRFEDEYFIDDLVGMLENGILPLIRLKNCLAKELVSILDPISFNSPDELILKATMIKQQGGGQLTLCQTLLVEIQNYLDRLYGCISTLISANNLEEARNMCLEHLKSDSRNAVIYGVLGAIEKRHGNAVGALNLLDRAYFYAGDRSIVGQNFVNLLTEQAYFAKAAAISKEIAADSVPDVSVAPPLVSFLIAAYNEELYIAECINSCLSQTYPNIEVCVTNDGSTDNTAEILKNSFSNDPRVKFTSFPTNRGKVQAFNAAYQMATGAYFALLGADDLAYRDRIENAYRHLTRHGLDMVVGGLLYCDDCLQPIAKKPPVRRREDYILETFFALNPTWGGTMFFNRRVAEVAFPIPTTLLFEDWWIGFNAALNRMRIDYLPVNFIMYRMHGANDCANADPSNRTMAMTKDFRRHFSYYDAFKRRIVDRADMTEEEKHHYYALIDEQVAYKRQVVDEYGHLLAPATSVGSAPQARDRRETLPGLKILFICHDFPPYRYAGAQLYALNLAKELKRQKFADVDVFHPIFREGYDRFEIVEAEFEGLKVFRLSKDITVGYDNNVKHPVVTELFDNFLSEHHYDCIHIHGLGQLSAVPIEVAKRHGIPTIMTLHDYWLLCAFWHLITPDQQLCSGPESPEKCAQCFLKYHRFNNPPQNLPAMTLDFMQKRSAAFHDLFGKLDYAVAPSRYLAGVFDKFGFHGVQVNSLGMPTMTPVPKNPHQGIVFGFVGQIITRKGIEVLLTAFSRIKTPDVSLEIWGKSDNPAYLDDVVKYCQKLHNVDYKGGYTPEQLPDIFARIDVAIVPSLMENYPLVVQEAFMNGTPVVASTAGGIPEVVINDHNGLLFEVGDASDLERNLNYLISNPARIAEYRGNIAPVKTIADDACFYSKVYQTVQDNTSSAQLPISRPRILFYFFKNVHIPILKPIYEACRRLHPDCDIGFACMPYAPEMRAGFQPEELDIIHSIGEKVYATPQEFQPDITFIADSVYPWVQNCGKLVHVGHGVLSKGQYYTDTEIARREEQADLVCVPGFHHAAVMKGIISKPVIATGMAKLDPIFSGQLTRDSELDRLNLPRNFRYLLFSPTFNDELSAIPFVRDRIAEVLPDRTVLLIKLHGSTKREYKELYQRLSETHPRVFYGEELDITPFLAIADVMISDVSSSMMEFAALDKPLILFNNPLWTSYPNYNPADIEFQWRDIGIQVNDLEGMRRAVLRSLDDPGEFSGKRRYYTDQLFANKTKGNAAERIVGLALSLFR